MASRLSRSYRSSNYRILTDSNLWATAWSDLKRAHKDKRARKRILMFSLAIGLMILLVVAAVAYLAFVIGTGAWFFLLFSIPIMMWIRRGSRKEFEPMRIAPAPEAPGARPPEVVRAEIIDYFARLALLYAVMVERAGSENYVKQKELPEDAEVITRRIHIDLLKAEGIWDRISAPDREAITLPDGHWTQARINHASTGIDPLRVLRWSLRVDFLLPLVGQQVAPDFSIARETVLNPKKLREGDALVDSDEIRAAHAQAHSVLIRCIAESISRGYFATEDEKTAEWAQEVSESLRGKQHEDLLLNDKLVSESTEDELRRGITMATIRVDILSQAQAVLDANAAPEGPLETVFATHPADARAETPVSS